MVLLIYICICIWDLDPLTVHIQSVRRPDGEATEWQGDLRYQQAAAQQTDMAQQPYFVSKKAQASSAVRGLDACWLPGLCRVSIAFPNTVLLCGFLAPPGR